MTRSSRIRRLAARFVPPLIALVALLAFALPASAAPPDPTLSISDLRTMLESGPLDGYMLTTMSGYTPEQIPLQVESLVDYPWGTLILFEASGPQIDKVGGIAAGMSGSPVYVDDGGTDKLVGAVSYGYSFTIGGMGMATPIEYMSAIESTYEPAPQPPAPGAYKVETPARSADGTVRSVVVARSAAAARNATAATGQVVMAPLGIMEIGGLPPQSKPYKKLAARLARSGLAVRPAGGSSAWVGPAAPDLEAGSPCAMIFSRGSVWYGAAGTVTYVNDGVALAFGHPMEWFGNTQAIMAAGWVAGTWPNSYQPFKLIAPRDTKGTVVQDRNWGIMAELGPGPDMFPVTTHVSLPAEGREVTDESSASEWLTRQREWSDLPTYLMSEALSNATDAGAYPGSAQTDTTVVVSDSTGQYTVHRTNLWDSPYDVTWYTLSDAEDVLWSLGSDPLGVRNIHVDSVALDVTMSPERRYGGLVGVWLPDGIKTGDNPVHVDYHTYGSGDLHTLDATLTLPAGVPTNGTLRVQNGGYSSYFSDQSTDTTLPPKTLAEIVDILNDSHPNSDLELVYTPWATQPVKGTTVEPVDLRIPTDLVFKGRLLRSSARVALQAQPKSVGFAGHTLLRGAVQGVTDPVELDVLRRDAGSSSEVLVRTLTLTPVNKTAAFRLKVGPLKHNATLIARTVGTDKLLPGNAEAAVKVRAGVALTAKAAPGGAELTARVSPADAGGKVVFQRLTGHRWVAVGEGAVKGGVAHAMLHAGTGVYQLRAVLSGSKVVAAGVSAQIVVRVR